MHTQQAARVRLINLVCLSLGSVFLVGMLGLFILNTFWTKELILSTFLVWLGFLCPILFNRLGKTDLAKIFFVFQIIIAHLIFFLVFNRESAMRAFILPISIIIIMLFSGQEQSLQLFFLLAFGAIIGWLEFLPKDFTELGVFMPPSTAAIFRIIIWVMAVCMNLLIVATAMRMVSQSEDLLRNLLIEANKQNDALQYQDNSFKENQEELLTMNQELMNQRERLEELIAERSTRLRYTEAQLLKQVEDLAESEKELRKYAEEMQLTNERLAAAKTKLQHTLEREREVNEQLATTIRELKSTQAQLTQAEKMASLGQLTAGIAHEINNPINFVYAGMDALHTNIEELLSWTSKENISPELHEEYDELIDETRTLLEDIQIGAMRTFEIVKGLRNFSRLDEEEIRKTHINDHISTTLILLRNQIKENQITVKRELDDSIMPIECYPGQLNQVLMNICSNAIQAIIEKQKNDIGNEAIEKATLKITTKNQDTSILLLISDNGIGMNEEVQKRIFEPFYTTKNVGEGTGLGMSITYGIIEKHQGKITVESKLGEGTTFEICLPKKLLN
ncbi:sensor histidine kinase [Bernardetia sp.]|uniref:sensor histidine kinase n=1 Tax=Bernardetia sp. TaxID=1937974 RepID=UPI0025C2F956|nr:ATP-binding protein [Bernardetia sp.]